jgi:hypothetical protein
MEERRPILVVFNAGDPTFLGRIDGSRAGDTFIPSDELKGQFISNAKQSMSLVYDCYPIGNRQVNGPQGPIVVPVLGTMNWCFLECVRVMRALIRWYYFPEDQSDDTHNEFQKVYSEFTKQLDAAKVQHAMEAANLQVATPGDIKRMEAAAKKMGLGTGPNLTDMLKDGRPPRR